jgi:hypothetical protein
MAPPSNVVMARKTSLGQTSQELEDRARHGIQPKVSHGTTPCQRLAILILAKPKTREDPRLILASEWGSFKSSSTINPAGLKECVPPFNPKCLNNRNIRAHQMHRCIVGPSCRPWLTFSCHSTKKRIWSTSELLQYRIDTSVDTFYPLR